MAIFKERDPFDQGPVRTAVTAAGGPASPPREWFNNPNLEALTPITVTSDGRVYGHIAPWNQPHIGMPGRVTAPRSKTDYAYFKTGSVMTASGEEVPVGQLTLSGGHAPLQADASAAAKHYDDTASGWADINVGEDQFGIWASGAVRPGVTDEQIRIARATAPSGDWRPIGNGLEMVAACQVNVPGFPVCRARVASGQILALVAAGAQEMQRIRLLDALVDPVRDQRVNDLQTVVEEQARQIETLTASVEPLRAARKEDLRKRVAAEPVAV